MVGVGKVVKEKWFLNLWILIRWVTCPTHVTSCFPLVVKVTWGGGFYLPTPKDTNFEEKPFKKVI